jgi:hypothetical protein
MFLTIVIWFLRVAAPLGGLAVLGATVPKLLGSHPLPGGFRLPVIALELVENVEQVNHIKGVLSPDEIRRALNFDLYAFIPLYVALFLALSYWLIRRDIPYAYFLGIAVGSCVVGAAVFDVIENAQTFSALRELDQLAVDRIRQAALVKWSLFFVMMALLAVPFAWRGGWVFAVAGVYLAAAGVGVMGVIGNRPLIEWAFALVGLALIPTGEAIRLVAERRPT